MLLPSAAAVATRASVFGRKEESAGGEGRVCAGGHPSVEISIIEESNKHKALDLLTESAQHEKKAIMLYENLLEIVHGRSIYIEEYAREMIKTEEIHGMELSKMLKDYSQ